MQVHKYASAQICKCTCMQVYKYASVQVFKYTNMQVYKYVFWSAILSHMQKAGDSVSLTVRIKKFGYLTSDQYAKKPVCKYTGIQVYSFTRTHVCTWDTLSIESQPILVSCLTL